MTDAITSADIRAELNDIARDLATAREHIALLAVLNAAQTVADGLVKRADLLTAKLAKTQEVEAKASRDALFAGLSKLKIAETVNERASGLLNNRILITYDRPVWDGHESVPTTITIKGFEALEPRVYSWIIERHADKIPASILALVPGNPRDALDSYMLALGRGFLKA